MAAVNAIKAIKLIKLAHMSSYVFYIVYVLVSVFLCVKFIHLSSKLYLRVETRTLDAYSIERME